MSDHPEDGRPRLTEGERIAELRAYEVLDSEPEAAFDGLVNAAATIADVPTALVSLVDSDRQWWKARVGIEATEGDRESAFCDWVVRTEAEVVVNDATADPRFEANPLVTAEEGIRFYAGFPLQAPSGALLGTLCVVDRQPRELSSEQSALLRVLAEQVMTQLQLRRELIERERQLRERTELLERLAESEARYRTLMHNSFDVIIGHRDGNQVAYLSPQMQAMVGMTAEEMQALDALGPLLHPDDLPGIRAGRRGVEQGQGSTHTGRVRHVDGSWHTLEISFLPILDDDGRLHEFLSTARDVTAEVAAEEALAAANEEVFQRGQQLEEAQAVAQVGSWTYDVATQSITWTREMKRIFGLPDGFQPSLDSYRLLIHPEDRDVLTGSTDRALTHGGLYEVEHRLVRPDGEERVLLARGHVELDDAGRPLSIRGTGQDVTDARRVEAELRQTRDLFAQVIGATEQSIIATDRDGVITVFNAGAERMLGYTADEMIGRRPETLHDQAELVARGGEIGELGDLGELGHPAPPGTAAGRPVPVSPPVDGPPGNPEWTYVRKDGERRLVQLTVATMSGPDGEATGHIRVATDVTEQHRLQRERDEHATMLRAVIENNQSIIYVKDLDARYLMVNKAWEEAIGLPEAEVIGRTDAEAVNAELAPMWAEANERGRHGLYRAEEYNEGPHGRRWYDSVKVPLRDPSGQVYAICGISLDITENRRAEQAQRQAVEAMATARDAAIAATKAKSAFLATMSHEIRTPMNAVIGMTGLLLDSALDPDQRDLLETVRSSGDQLLSIINDILDFSKIEAGDLELEDRPFDLREAVESTVAQFAGSCGEIDLISHLDDACPRTVVGDVVRLRQVIGNLVGNAVKFTRQGEVLVRVAAEPEPGPEPEPEPEDDDPPPGRVRLRFTVTDSGIGISPEGMSRLFKSFSQVDASTTRVYGGTGLGLAISKAIVEAMGGDLTVTSTPGIGSEFSFAVALGRHDGPDEGPIPPPELAVLQNRRALIVDDNTTNRRILQLQLEGHGMTCTLCASPLEALKVVGEGQVFEVAVLDYQMPIMDGGQLALALRALPAGRDLPLLLLSSVGTRERNSDDLFAAILTKPTRSGTLLQTVAAALTSPEVLEGQAAQAPGPGPTGTAPTGTAPTGTAPTGTLPTGPGPTGPVPVQATAPEAHADAAPRMARRAGDRKLRILLAEDNEINQKVGRLMLAKIGHQVDIAINGQEALDAVLEGAYDVVLMDMHMPVMDGLESTRRIRAELPPERQPLIIAMTASVTTEDRAACTDAGMDGYLAKPVRAADLTAALAGAVPRTSPAH